jgi:chromosome segregation ATPase
MIEMDDLTLCRMELAEVRNQLTTLGKQIQALQTHIQPYYQQHIEIAETIKATHTPSLNFNVRAVAERTPLYEQLDQLRADYLPTLNELREKNRVLRELNKQSRHIQNWIDKLQSKRP